MLQNSRRIYSWIVLATYLSGIAAPAAFAAQDGLGFNNDNNKPPEAIASCDEICDVLVSVQTDSDWNSRSKGTWGKDDGSAVPIGIVKGRGTTGVWGGRDDAWCAAHGSPTSRDTPTSPASPLPNIMGADGVTAKDCNTKVPMIQNSGDQNMSCKEYNDNLMRCNYKNDGQLMSYCQAYKKADEGKTWELILFAMDVATAATCGAVCASSKIGSGAMVGGAVDKICSVAACAAGVGEVGAAIFLSSEPLMAVASGVIGGAVGLNECINMGKNFKGASLEMHPYYDYRMPVPKPQQINPFMAALMFGGGSKAFLLGMLAGGDAKAGILDDAAEFWGGVGTKVKKKVDKALIETDATVTRTYNQGKKDFKEAYGIDQGPKPQAAPQAAPPPQQQAVPPGPTPDQAAADRAAAAQKHNAQVKAADKKAAGDKKAAEEKAAGEKKAAEEKAAGDKKAADEKAAGEKKAADAEAAKKAEAEKKDARGTEACVTTVTFAALAALRYMNWKNHESSKKSSCDSVKSVFDSSKKTIAGGSGSTNSNGGGLGTGDAGSTGANAGSSGSKSASTSAGDLAKAKLESYHACRDKGMSEGTCQQMAGATDGGIMQRSGLDNVAVPAAQQMDLNALNDHLKNSRNAGDALGGALSGMGEMGAALASVGQAVQDHSGDIKGLGDMSSSAYSGGGGGGGSGSHGSGSSDSGLGGLASLFGGGARTPTAGGAAETTFGQKPVDNDIWHSASKDSIFEIVTGRYSRTAERVK